MKPKPVSPNPLEPAPARQTTGFPFGIAREAPLVPAGNDWWRPMTDAEAEAEEWIDERRGFSTSDE